MRHQIEHIGVAVGLLTMLLPAVCTAGEGTAGHIALQMTAEKEVKALTETGQEETKRVAAELVIPGEEVIYTIVYSNIGPDPTTNVVITNPLPEHMVYTPGSANGASTDIAFSVDGESFDQAEMLTVMADDGRPRPATEQDYTHIRWVLQSPLAPGANGEVSYRARLQ